MTLIDRSKLMAKVAGIASTATLAALISLPAMAQSMTTEQDDRNIGPSAVPGETLPGPSETPSGSPSVPSVSNQDDPNHMTEPGSMSGEQGISPNQGTSGNRIQQSATDRMNDMNNGVGGPSAVEGQSFPGPSETPSGSPSVPSVSDQDDPNHMEPGNQPMRDARTDRMNDMNNSDQDLGGPSAVPTESFPGPSETPSGTPSVPGVSNQDDPGNMRMSPGS